MEKKYYLTTAIAYASAIPHIGMYMRPFWLMPLLGLKD
jgi:methionyl-tRNA synthetase